MGLDSGAKLEAVGAQPQAGHSEQGERGGPWVPKQELRGRHAGPSEQSKTSCQEGFHLEVPEPGAGIQTRLGASRAEGGGGAGS